MVLRNKGVQRARVLTIEHPQYIPPRAEMGQCLVVWERGDPARVPPKLARFLATGQIWGIQNKAQKQQTMQLMSNLLGLIAQQITNLERRAREEGEPTFAGARPAARSADGGQQGPAEGAEGGDRLDSNDLDDLPF